MEHLKVSTFFQGPSYHRFLIFTIWICGLHDVVPQKTTLQPKSHVPVKFMLSDPPIGLFDPIEISPAVLPPNPYPVEPPSPMYPSFPDTYQPVLTGRCPMNFSSISNILDRTASDCAEPLAALIGNAICCPQVNSLMHIFLGAYNNVSNALVLHPAAADDCFSDITSILASRGANSTIPTLCSVKSSNLTGGSCPVIDAKSFEKEVNTSKLLDACSTIDPLKECCRPSCQPAIMEAALHISSGGASVVDSSNISGAVVGVDVVNDCKTVVYAWLSRKLLPEAANSAFRMLSSCKVNKAYGQQGCLLRSLPTDIIFDNATGFSFTCDLSDNIAAPWPSSSSLQSLSLCAPEMSLPALPIPASGSFGTHVNGARILTSFIIYFISCMCL
ncbi:uncharacterized GPI-anchored protein At1g61900-like isoform X3 [Phoenix dactylifera]|uniref:Uncharacterized GPI-anchored protein At1g61900-like isoform X3 n=1 Tax=Phoenix dactylifera TaxID=42345 RepID=A0A8B8J404_PHODC|nr:uncharacterized GPI-anchored protein At1g61900-like isoform X3 [Phoenix dactylifera]